ncbi:NitT/TauT family transport system permease protein [Martelella mediterranea]|uniref:NitT/TauT family transport system permease protein n=1 Tax=Martelella mediterranea TaxID=293089 RepID=A0A4R3NGD3_9HYPH|nr:NitT/TauT family transport system permease protein [Martelella mediterranea]
MIERFPALWPNLWQTIVTTTIGFALSIIIGIFFGALIGMSRLAYDALYPILVGISSIPKVALIPIFVVWLGAGTGPAILTACVISFFPIVVNVATGLATAEPELEDILQALNASKLDIFWNVGLPRTMPYLFAAMKVAISIAFIGSITSETIASNRGIGNAMLIATTNFDMPLAFAALMLISITGVVFYFLFVLLENRMTGWAQRNKKTR